MFKNILIALLGGVMMPAAFAAAEERLGTMRQVEIRARRNLARQDVDNMIFSRSCAP